MMLILSPNSWKESNTMCSCQTIFLSFIMIETVQTVLSCVLHIERCSLLEDNEMADRIQQGVFPYPPPVMLHFVTRWDMSWLEMTQLGMNGRPNTTLLLVKLSLSLSLCGFFLRTSEMSLFSVVCPVDVLLMFFSRSPSLSYPHSFSHSCISRSFLIHRQSHSPPPSLVTASVSLSVPQWETLPSLSFSL